MTARLHHERIAHSEAMPERWLLLTHGIYGAGSNWRGIARKLVDRRRDWGVVLVDLRHHGRSETGDPPHTLDACADDISALVDALRTEIGDVRALAGHSFGGKVMLAARSRVDVAQTWMLDASPSAWPGALDDPDNSVARVLSLLERMPEVWATRDAFVEAVVAEGQDVALARWLAMNLVPASPGAPELDNLVNRLDPSVLRALLESYYATDLWDVVADAGRGRLEIVIATKSPVFDAAARARATASGDHVHVQAIEAGHWLHIEAPEAVVEHFVMDLP